MGGEGADSDGQKSGDGGKDEDGAHGSFKQCPGGIHTMTQVPGRTPAESWLLYAAERLPKSVRPAARAEHAVDR